MAATGAGGSAGRGGVKILHGNRVTVPSDEFVDLSYGVGLEKAQEFFSDTPAS